MERLTKEFLYEEFVVKRRSDGDIAKQFGVGRKKISYLLSKYKLYGIRGKLKYTIDLAKVCHSPEMYYYAGLVSTDGHLDKQNKRIMLRMCNDGIEDVFKGLKDYFSFSGQVRHYYKGEHCKVSHDLTISSRELYTFLNEELGITDVDKTHTLKVLSSFPNEDCLKMYLRGVLEGDGNIHVRRVDGHIRGGEFRIAKGSKDFIDGLYNLLGELFDKNEIHLHTQSSQFGKYPALTMHVKESKKFYSWVYNGYPKFRCKDKLEKAKLLVDDIV